jgi:hypothetical protein
MKPFYFTELYQVFNKLICSSMIKEKFKEKKSLKLLLIFSPASILILHKSWTVNDILYIYIYIYIYNMRTVFYVIVLGENKYDDAEQLHPCQFLSNRNIW